MTSMKICWTVILLISLVVFTLARPQEFDEDEDSHGHSDDRKGAGPSRVQIKVYRGPTKTDGSAPWGFWVKQPSDDK